MKTNHNYMLLYRERTEEEKPSGTTRQEVTGEKMMATIKAKRNRAP